MWSVLSPDELNLAIEKSAVFPDGSTHVGRDSDGFGFHWVSMIDRVWVEVMIQSNPVFFQKVSAIYVPYCCICHVQVRVSQVVYPV